MTYIFNTILVVIIVILPLPIPNSERTPKKPTQIRVKLTVMHDLNINVKQKTFCKIKHLFLIK